MISFELLCFGDWDLFVIWVLIFEFYFDPYQPTRIKTDPTKLTKALFFKNESITERGADILGTANPRMVGRHRFYFTGDLFERYGYDLVPAD